jgi:branched-chain amino acid transport system substrate-binding protein
VFHHSKASRLIRHALALSLLGAAALAQAADLKIGVILPMSGPISAQGLSSAKGIQAGLKYQDTVNGHKITVIQLDDASDPSASVRDARKLIDQDHVDVLIGTSGVPGAMAIAAVARDTKTPLVSFTPLSVTGE